MFCYGCTCDTYALRVTESGTAQGRRIRRYIILVLGMRTLTPIVMGQRKPEGGSKAAHTSIYTVYGMLINVELTIELGYSRSTLSSANQVSAFVQRGGALMLSKPEKEPMDELGIVLF